ncbi:MAG: nucleoside-diphosphate kinase [Kiritimatiellaeota bacterium]|nr:nucleoside-diphosphate kinase [Kiritimatiellota bacterium]
MGQELAYAAITPYTIRKSRTGAVLARLLGQVSCELIAAQMFAPTGALSEILARSIQPVEGEDTERYRELIRAYIRQNFSPAPDGHRHRVLMLVFQGENAVAELARVTGHLRISASSGETIRDTFGDLVWNDDGSVRYFEPAVVIADTSEAARRDLRIWSGFAQVQPPVLENICVYRKPSAVQQTLVLIKPDSWRQKSSRPGAIVDMFSRTGLRIIGCKVCRMSVNQALEFYGPVKNVLREKLAPGIGQQARKLVEEHFGIALPDSVTACLAREVGIPYAANQFEELVAFMCGRRPSECPESERDAPGDVSCLALVYEGEDAVRKIRNVLGPTDPTKAPDGTVRREFGHNVMVNTAHASDSPENAQREMGILRVREADFAAIVGPRVSLSR